MIEPTETESATLDEFIEVMLTIAREAEENPELVLNAPSKTPVTRLDESGRPGSQFCAGRRKRKYKGDKKTGNVGLPVFL